MNNKFQEEKSFKTYPPDMRNHFVNVKNCVGKLTVLDLCISCWIFQAAYQVGCYGIGLHASTVLWNHFVADLPPPKSDIEKLTAKEDYKLALKR